MPDFWEHPKEAQVQMKKIKDLKAWIEGYEDVERAVDDLEVAFDFVKEGDMDEAELDAMYADAIDPTTRLSVSNCATCCAAKKTRSV